MATYQTIAEMLASTDNMTVIRNNSRQDDGTDTLTGVDWFKFKNVVANNVYVSGNGWINFGTSSEGGLKVNRRDQASWYVWREEANIRNANNKVLRIRWRGYSQYNTTAEAYLLEFDVVLCNTGDIILKIHTWPTSAANGVNQLEAASTVGYSPSGSSTEFSFIHQDENGSYFTLENFIDEVFTPRFWLAFHASGGIGTMKKQFIELGVPTDIRKNGFVKLNHDFMGWDTDDSADTVVYTDEEEVEDLAGDGETIDLYAVWRKTWAWLLRDGNGKTYTVDLNQDNEQVRRELTGITTLTAATFYENGFQFPPDSAILIDLYKPTLCKWNVREAPVVQADVRAIPIVPQPQLAVFKATTVKKSVQLVTITGDETSKWNVSFDRGESWYKHTGSAWAQVTTDGDGCVKSVLEALDDEDWAEKVENNSLQFRVWMMAGGWVNRIRIDY